jgi:hypothetical protein
MANSVNDRPVGVENGIGKGYFLAVRMLPVRKIILHFGKCQSVENELKGVRVEYENKLK